jgi:manganese/zinc/iron transport system permease protein
MHFPDPHTVILLATGGLTATACALVGSFLLLRRMALVGDAISHAILPGVVLGFVLSGERQPLAILPAAAAVGLATVWLIELLYRSRRLSEDSSTAVVFPALFALGVLLIAHIRYVDLDLDCVIFGRIEEADRRPLLLFGRDWGPRALWFLGIMTAVDAALVLVLWKELKLSAFDPALATSLGFSPTLLHYLLMMAVSLTAVAAFEAVGAVLVVSFLVVPAAAAYLITDRLWLMVLLAVLLGWAAVGLGYVVSSEQLLNSQAAATMAACAGILFFLAWVLSPQHGLLAFAWRRHLARRRFADHLLLSHLRELGADRDFVPLAGDRLLWPPGRVRRIVARLQARGLVEERSGTVQLTCAGLEAIERFQLAAGGKAR